MINLYTREPVSLQIPQKDIGIEDVIKTTKTIHYHNSTNVHIPKRINNVMTVKNGFLCFVTVAVLLYIGCIKEDIKPGDPPKGDIRLFTTVFHEEDLTNEQLHFFSTNVDSVLLTSPLPAYVNTLKVHTDIVVLFFDDPYFVFNEKFWQKTPLELISKTVILLKSTSYSLGRFWTLEGLLW